MIIQNYGLQNISEIYNLIHPDSMYIKKFITLILTVLTAIASLGQNPVDSMRVLFQISHDQFDPMVGDNRASMADFIKTETESYSTHPYRFALKTNMLYDVALMPNLELEWHINNKWSLAVENDIAWWKKDSKHKYYQIAMISSEVRRWFKLRNPWHGMYVGLFAGVGKYDLENGKNGYMGEGYMTGLSLGYMWPIAKNFSFETGIGAGYMYTRYKEYKPFDGHYLYQRTKSLNYFGPLKLKFSIAWRFNDINKHKKNNPAQ